MASTPRSGFPPGDPGKDCAVNETGVDAAGRRRTEDALRESESKLALQNRVARLFLTVPGDAMFGAVLKLVLEEAGSQYGLFGYLNDRGDLVAPALTYDVRDGRRIEGKSVCLPREAWGGTMWGRVLLEGRSERVNDPVATPHNHMPIRRALSVPILLGERIIGVFTLANKADDYTARDQEQLETIAHFVAAPLAARLESKRAEEALAEKTRLNQTLLDALPCVALLLTREDRTIVASNEAARKAGAFPGTRCYSSWGQRQAPCPWCLAPGCWGTEEAQHVEVEADGIVWDAHWAPAGPDLFLHYAFDITERKRAEQERRGLEAQVLHAQKLESLGVLAGGIAHDFNNLLMAILGNADLALREMSPAAPARSSISNIVAASQRAAELCRQMLAYSGKGRFVVEPVSLSDIVREMAHMLEVSVSKKAILRCNLDNRLPPVMADATQMRQIVMNLVINASEALGSHEGAISVATSAIACDRQLLDKAQLGKEAAEGSYVCLEVTDTGCGMDEATLSKIFDPFFSTKFTGRGLGLAAVLGIVRAHKGAITVSGKPGEGSVFRILLPAAGSPGESPVAPGRSHDTWHGEGTVLLVDDEEMVRHLGRRMLERLGFTVLMAANGREALEIFRARSGEIDCVVLDLTMPVMDGEETFGALKAIEPDARIVLSSGYSEEEVAERFAGKSPAGVVEKPYLLSRLAEVMRRAIEP